MNTYDKYIWQWAMMYYAGRIQEMGYSSLYTPGEYFQMTLDMSEKAKKFPFFRDETKPEISLSRRMSRLMTDYNNFIMPSLKAALHRGQVTFVTPYNATGRWSYADRHGDVLVVADEEMAEDLRHRVTASGMQLQKGIQICAADITDAGSLENLWNRTAFDNPVYFSLGLLPLTATPEYIRKTLRALSSLLTPVDNLAFGFVSSRGSNLPKTIPIYQSLDMEKALSRLGYNVYEDGSHMALDGTEVTFMLRVKKINRHK
ncbi:MAG: hypothetical protein IJ410_01220 [Oscillospiraceae bacterium]|nr:hypothetical protein [Oscillospiraceae bacterium]